LIKLKGINFLL